MAVKRGSLEEALIAGAGGLVTGITGGVLQRREEAKAEEFRQQQRQEGIEDLVAALTAREPFAIGAETRAETRRVGAETRATTRQKEAETRATTRQEDKEKRDWQTYVDKSDYSFEQAKKIAKFKESLRKRGRGKSRAERDADTARKIAEFEAKEKIKLKNKEAFHDHVVSNPSPTKPTAAEQAEAGTVQAWEESVGLGLTDPSEYLPTEGGLLFGEVTVPESLEKLEKDFGIKPATGMKIINREAIKNLSDEELDKIIEGK